MQEIKEFKSGASFYSKLGCRVHPVAEKLDVGKNCARAITVQNRHFMYAVHMENKERGMACGRTHTEHTAVVELNCQPQRL